MLLCKLSFMVFVLLGNNEFYIHTNNLKSWYQNH